MKLWLIWAGLGLVVANIIVGFIINVITGRHNLSRVPTKWLVIALIADVIIIGGLTVLPQVIPNDGNEGSSSAPAKDVPPQGWRTVATAQFDQPDGPAAGPLHDACTNSAAYFESNRLTLNLDSCRDYTYQVAYQQKPYAANNLYYFRADVQYLGGPADAYCAILVGWRDHEHYYAFKLGRDNYEITRNKGGLPHEGVDGPRTVPGIKPDAANRLVVLAQSQSVSFYINGLEVARRNSRNFPELAGEMWLAAQATHKSNLVECAFDNVELRVP